MRIYETKTILLSNSERKIRRLNFSLIFQMKHQNCQSQTIVYSEMLFDKLLKCMLDGI